MCHAHQPRRKAADPMIQRPPGYNQLQSMIRLPGLRRIHPARAAYLNILDMGWEKVAIVDHKRERRRSTQERVPRGATCTFSWCRVDDGLLPPPLAELRRTSRSTHPTDWHDNNAQDGWTKRTHQSRARRRDGYRGVYHRAGRRPDPLGSTHPTGYVLQSQEIHRP
jgi:hypothetical protein